MGVSVKDTMAETRMVTARVTANSRKSRPTMSPMNNKRNEHGNQGDGQRNNGEADLRGPFQRRLKRRLAFFDVARDVLDHHDGVVHHEPGGNGQGHQAQIVQAVAEQVHHAEGAHQGKRNGDAGNNGGGKVAQEEENDHHHQRHRQHQLEFHVGHGSANGGGPVGQNGDLDGGGQRFLELIEKGLDAIDHRDDIRARLALNIHDDGREYHSSRRLGGRFPRRPRPRPRRSSSPGSRSGRPRPAARSQRPRATGHWRQFDRTGAGHQSCLSPG